MTTPAYRPIHLQVMEHAWLAIGYAIVATVALYALGWYVSDTLYFIAMEIPTLATVAYVLAPDPPFRRRVPFLWASTACAVWAFSHTAPTNRVLAELFPGAVLVVFLYLLVRAISGSWTETSCADNQAECSSLLLATWGATLQIAFLFSGVFSPFLKPFLGKSYAANAMNLLIQGISIASPTRWLPSWLLLLGLFLLAGLHP